MNTAELFTIFLRRLLFAFLLILLVASVTNAHGQNAGTIGIYTKQIQVFTAQSSTVSSAIFPDNGFACNFLNFQNSSFLGMIDVEWSPTGVAPFYTLTQASYSGVGGTDSGYHTLQVGGYFPNMRSTVTVTSGSLSAWYTASSGPCPLISSGLGSNGPSSPVNCDKVFSLTVPATTTSAFLDPVNTGDTLVLCGFTLSFQAAPNSSFVQLSWAASNACGTPVTGWYVWTTAASPQILVVPILERSPLPNVDAHACFWNNTNVALTISASYASVHPL